MVLRNAALSIAGEHVRARKALANLDPVSPHRARDAAYIGIWRAMLQLSCCLYWNRSITYL